MELNKTIYAGKQCEGNETKGVEWEFHGLYEQLEGGSRSYVVWVIDMGMLGIKRA